MLEKFVVAKYDMACLTTIATTSSNYQKCNALFKK